MYNDVVTVFNFHKRTGNWYTTVFKNVNLLESTARASTTDRGKVNEDAVELMIRVLPDKSAHTIIYEPYLVISNEGDTFVDSRGVRLSFQSPDTKEVRWFMRPKAYAGLEDPKGYFTFLAERDFFVVGNYASDPIADEDYDEGLYHAMNDAQDGVYMITSATYFTLLPHFEIGGR